MGRCPLTKPHRPDGLTLADVPDQRAYERVRDGYRQQIIELKRRRRVALGPIMTLVFENVDTVRFQVLEMARAERIATDEGIQQELDVYNRLLPGRGELSATLFIELTTPEDLRKWLPALVGVERSLAIELSAPGGPTTLVQGMPEAAHAAALTREDGDRRGALRAVRVQRVRNWGVRSRPCCPGGATSRLQVPCRARRTDLSRAAG